MSRIKELLLKCADNLDKQCDPLNDQFCKENEITHEELADLSTQMAAYIRGVARSPKELQAKVLVYAVVDDDKKSGAIVGRFDEFVRSAQLKKKVIT